MGSEEYVVEEPKHKVCLNDFYLDRNEVSQRHFENIMGYNPSYFKGSELPVESVTWPEANDYCRKLGLRLPSEGEWEYAARAGTTSNYSWGFEIDERFGWYEGNSNGATHPVGQKASNQFGFYDMNGNVWEWVSDWFRPEYFETNGKTGMVKNPQGPSTGQFLVIKGGSFEDDSFYLRSASRFWYPPDIHFRNLGFRCAGNPSAVEVKTSQ